MYKRFGKKGFTLVEMLVVVAIIALLVSIIVPTVTKSTTKSAAAANAANLRSVEGQLSALRFTNPDALENYLMQDVSSYIGAWIGTIQGVIQTAPNWGVFLALTDALANIEDLLVENIFYGQDGKIILKGMVIEAPAAKALSVEGVNVTKKTQMEVIVSDNGIIATYGGMTSEVFAAIAEDGDAGDYKDVAHTYVDSNKDNVCDICNGEYPHTDKEIADGIIGGVISGAHTCTDENQDCKCDDPDCGMSQPHEDDNRDYNCDNCGALLDHTHKDNDKNNACDVNKCTATCTVSECGCMQGKTETILGFIQYAGTCENSACKHEHKQGEKCTKTTTTWSTG